MLKHSAITLRTRHFFSLFLLIVSLDMGALRILGTTNKNTKAPRLDRQLVTTLGTLGAGNRLRVDGFVLHQRPGVIARWIIITANETTMLTVAHGELTAALGTKFIFFFERVRPSIKQLLVYLGHDTSRC
jgi:hypothetical protein